MIDRRSALGATLVAIGLGGLTACDTGEARAGAGDTARTATAGSSSGPTPNLPAAARARLDELLSDVESVGGMVVAVRGGRILGLYAWGDADRQPKRAVTDQTLFHIGSNGKHVTGLAVMQLVDQGKIDLAQPLSHYVDGLPDMIGSTPIADLVHQTSGLPDYLDAVEDWSAPLPRRAVLRAVTAEDRSFEPGEAWEYSNTNYLVLGWLIEAVSGMSYVDYLNRHLFGPAHTPQARPDSTDDDIAERARPYSWAGSRFVRAPVMNDAVSHAADGGVLFSAHDVGPWRKAIEDHVIVSARALDLAQSPGDFGTGRQAPYGAGYVLEQTRGKPFRHHSGSVPGFSSWWLTLDGVGVSVLAVTNSDGDEEAPLEDMALAMAEGVAPGSTFLGLPIRTDDRERTATLRAAFKRAEADLPDRLLAEELLASGGETAPDWGIKTADAFGPVERWPVRGGEMVRYRWVDSDDDVASHVVVGWTDDDRIFWIW